MRLYQRAGTDEACGTGFRWKGELLRPQPSRWLTSNTCGVHADGRGDDRGMTQGDSPQRPPIASSINRTLDKQSLVRARSLRASQSLPERRAPRRRSGTGGDPEQPAAAPEPQHDARNRLRHLRARAAVRDVSARAVRLHLRARPLQGTARLGGQGAAQHLRAARTSKSASGEPSRCFTATCWQSGAAPQRTSPRLRGHVIWWNGATWTAAAEKLASRSRQISVPAARTCGSAWVARHGLSARRHRPHALPGGGRDRLRGEPDGRVRVRLEIICWHWDGRGHERAEEAAAARARAGWSRPRLDGGWDGQADRGVAARGTGHQYLHPQHRHISIWAVKQNYGCEQQQLVDGRTAAQLQPASGRRARTCGRSGRKA